MKVILSVLLLTISSFCFAQENSKWSYIPQATFSIGGSWQKFDGLSSRVANYPQYEAIRDNTATLQLGWLKERRRLVSDFNLLGGSSLSGNRDSKSSLIRYFGLGANVGYDLLKSEKFLLYPLAGIGYQWYQAKFFTDNSAVPFDAVLQSVVVQNSIHPIGFKNSFFTYTFGLGFAAKAPKGDGSIGLKASYTGGFTSRSWKSNDNLRLANSPEDNLSQFNIALVFAMKPMMMKH